MPGGKNNNRRGWSTKPLRGPDDPPYRRVEVKFPAPIGADLDLLARHSGTSASGVIRELVDKRIRGLDRRAPDWRATAEVTDPFAPDNFDA